MKMQRLEVSGAVRPLYGSLGVKRLITSLIFCCLCNFFSCLLPFLLSMRVWLLIHFQVIFWSCIILMYII